MKTWQKLALALLPIVAFSAYSILNPRWFFHTFTAKTMHCGEVTQLYMEHGECYVALLDKDLKRTIIYRVSKTRWVNFRQGDYACERLCEWKVNN